MRREIFASLLFFATAVTAHDSVAADPFAGAPQFDKAQIPKWSEEDLQFFLHGSMSTEVVPEPVLRAFTRTYRDLFKRPDLSNLGLIPDREAGLPIGISRREV